MSGPGNLWSRRLRADFIASLVVVALLALAPLFVTSPYTLGILVVSIYFALLALGWNLLAGFTWQFSLAPAAYAPMKRRNRRARASWSRPPSSQCPSIGSSENASAWMSKARLHSSSPTTRMATSCMARQV